MLEVSNNEFNKSLNKNKDNDKGKGNCVNNIVDTKFNTFVLNTSLHERLKANKHLIKTPIVVTDELLDSFCNTIDDNKILLDYRIFKYIARPNTYDILVKHIAKKINFVLGSNSNFSVHICTKLLTIAGADKHILFIYKLTETLNSAYPDKLDKCYIYDAPYLFQKIIGMLSLIIDKKTLSKITIVGN
jgi:hypothetical protein